MAGASIDIGVVMHGFGVANEALGVLQQGFERLEEKIGDGGEKLKGYGKELRNLQQTGATFLARFLKEQHKHWLQAASDMEQYNVMLTTINKSSVLARKDIEKFRKSALLPGLNFESLVKGTTQLRSAGIEADLARRAVEGVANAMALVGGSADDTGGVIRAFTQIQAKGKVFAEEIQQIAERLPQIRVILQETFGTANTEIIQKMGLTATEFLEGTTQGLEKLSKAQNTYQNSLKNLKESTDKLGATLGKSLIPQQTFIADLFSKITSSLSKMPTFFATLSAGAGQILKWTALIAAFAAAVITVGTALAATAPAWGTFLVGAGTWTLANLGRGAAVAGLVAFGTAVWNQVSALIAARKELDDYGKAVGKVGKINKEFQYGLNLEGWIRSGEVQQRLGNLPIVLEQRKGESLPELKLREAKTTATRGVGNKQAAERLAFMAELNKLKVEGGDGFKRLFRDIMAFLTLPDGSPNFEEMEGEKGKQLLKYIQEYLLLVVDFDSLKKDVLTGYKKHDPGYLGGARDKAIATFYEVVDEYRKNLQGHFGLSTRNLGKEKGGAEYKKLWGSDSENTKAMAESMSYFSTSLDVYEKLVDRVRKEEDRKEVWGNQQLALALQQKEWAVARAVAEVTWMDNGEKLEQALAKVDMEEARYNKDVLGPAEFKYKYGKDLSGNQSKRAQIYRQELQANFDLSDKRYKSSSKRVGLIDHEAEAENELTIALATQNAEKEKQLALNRLSGTSAQQGVRAAIIQRDSYKLNREAERKSLEGQGVFLPEAEQARRLAAFDAQTTAQGLKLDSAVLGAETGVTLENRRFALQSAQESIRTGLAGGIANLPGGIGVSAGQRGYQEFMLQGQARLDNIAAEAGAPGLSDDERSLKWQEYATAQTELEGQRQVRTRDMTQAGEERSRMFGLQTRELQLQDQESQRGTPFSLLPGAQAGKDYELEMGVIDRERTSAEQAGYKPGTEEGDAMFQEFSMRETQAGLAHNQAIDQDYKNLYRSIIQSTRQGVEQSIDIVRSGLENRKQLNEDHRKALEDINLGMQRNLRDLYQDETLTFQEKERRKLEILREFNDEREDAEREHAGALKEIYADVANEFKNQMIQRGVSQALDWGEGYLGSKVPGAPDSKRKPVMGKALQAFSSLGAWASSKFRDNSPALKMSLMPSNLSRAAEQVNKNIQADELEELINFDSPHNDIILQSMAREAGHSQRSAEDMSRLVVQGFQDGYSDQTQSGGETSVNVSGHFELGHRELQFIADETNVMRKRGLIG